MNPTMKTSRSHTTQILMSKNLHVSILVYPINVDTNCVQQAHPAGPHPRIIAHMWHATKLVSCETRHTGNIPLFD